MPDTADPAEHVKPFVHNGSRSKALHFSIAEVQSRMQLSDPYALDLEYTRTMMGFLLFKPDPASIAMIGLGGGSLAKFCHRHLPRTLIQVVEINPHVIALRDEFAVPRDDERFTVLQGDGAYFVRHPPHRFEVLMVDGFDSSGQPPRLASQRFYDDCHDSLQPGGILVVNLHHGHRLFPMHLERIRCSFDSRVLVVDDGDHSNSIVFACKGHALRPHRTGTVRVPRGLSAVAAEQLMAALTRVKSALRDPRPDAGNPI